VWEVDKLLGYADLFEQRADPLPAQSSDETGGHDLTAKRLSRSCDVEAFAAWQDHIIQRVVAFAGPQIGHQENMI
jgi:hypothetical protein